MLLTVYPLNTFRTDYYQNCTREVLLHVLNFGRDFEICNIGQSCINVLHTDSVPAVHI